MMGPETLRKLDGKFLEMVTIPERITLCVHHRQVVLFSVLCATGYHGFKRNLDSSEIMNNLD